jgi:hypothetical protein
MVQENIKQCHMKLIFLIPNLDAFSECQETRNSCLKLCVRILIHMTGIKTLVSRKNSVNLRKDVYLKPVFFSLFFFFACALRVRFLKI